MFGFFKKMFGFFKDQPVSQLPTTFRLEDLCQEQPNVDYGIRPVEIVDQKMLEEFLSLKRRGMALWRHKSPQTGDGPKDFGGGC